MRRPCSCAHEPSDPALPARFPHQEDFIQLPLPPAPDGTPRNIVFCDLYCPDHGSGHPIALEAYRVEVLAVSLETMARRESREFRRRDTAVARRPR